MCKVELSRLIKITVMKKRVQENSEETSAQKCMISYQCLKTKHTHKTQQKKINKQEVLIYL